MTHDMTQLVSCLWCPIRKVNAIQLRQSLSKIITLLHRTGEPILLQKGRKPAAVLISLGDFKTRFVEKDADERRREVQRRIQALARKSEVTELSESVIRRLRNGDGSI